MAWSKDFISLMNKVAFLFVIIGGSTLYFSEAVPTKFLIAFPLFVFAAMLHDEAAGHLKRVTKKPQIYVLLGVLSFIVLFASPFIPEKKTSDQTNAASELERLAAIARPDIKFSVSDFEIEKGAEKYADTFIMGIQWAYDENPDCKSIDIIQSGILLPSKHNKKVQFNAWCNTDKSKLGFFNVPFTEEDVQSRKSFNIAEVDETDAKILCQSYFSENLISPHFSWQETRDIATRAKTLTFSGTVKNVYNAELPAKAWCTVNPDKTIEVVIK